jgi:hypothetical protein
MIFVTHSELCLSTICLSKLVLAERISWEFIILSRAQRHCAPVTRNINCWFEFCLMPSYSSTCFALLSQKLRDGLGYRAVFTVTYQMLKTFVTCSSYYRLVIGFIRPLQMVTSSNSSAIANSHILQFTTARTKFPQPAVSSPVNW